MFRRRENDDAGDGAGDVKSTELLRSFFNVMGAGAELFSEAGEEHLSGTRVLHGVPRFPWEPPLSKAFLIDSLSEKPSLPLATRVHRRVQQVGRQPAARGA